MSKAPFLVGITGGIGSGKTTVCKIFETLNVPIYYADDRAKNLMRTNSKLISDIIGLFGNQAYIDGQLNRQEIAKQAFSDSSLLTKLNQLVHPAVRVDFEKWASTASSATYVIKEAALLVETGSYKELNMLIVVSTDEDLRIQRVLKRDPHRTNEDVKKIIKEQLPEAEKRKVADFIVENNGSSSLINQVHLIHKKLIKEL